MERLRAGEVGDLVPARYADCDNHAIGSSIAHSRQQSPLADGARQVEVASGVAERSRHAATARVEIDDGSAGNAAEQRRRWRKPAHGLLMTMTVEKNPRRAGRKREPGTIGLAVLLDELLEQHGSIGHLPGAAPVVTSEQRRHVL